MLLSAAPIGNVDVMNSQLIAGWAFDADTGPTAVNVQISIDGKPTNVSANQARTDLASLGSTNHGFAYTVPTTLSPGDHAVTVSIINPIDGTLQALTTGTITNPPPFGNVDIITSSRIAGWVWDPNAGATALTVRVDVNGATVKTVTANNTRPDLASLGSTGHGYDMTGLTIPANAIVEVVAVDAPSGDPYVVYSTNHLPIGNVDIMNQSEIVGWGLDPDHMSTAIQVRVDIDGVAGTPFTANQARPDLAGISPGDVNHGFSFAVPSSLGPGPHTVKVYGLDLDSLVNRQQLLGSGTITNPPPYGNLDIATSTFVAGWAIDPNAGTSALTVQVKVDGVVQATLLANQDRPDLASLQMGNEHGYSTTLSGLSVGPHKIDVVAMDFPSNQPQQVSEQVIGNHLPGGSLDMATNTVIGGWAYDPDPNGSVQVQLFVDGIEYNQVTANLARPDLATMLPTSNVGYMFTTPTLSFGDHQIQVFALDTFTNTPVLLGTQTVTNHAPVGNIDIATPTTVVGWAYDQEAGANPIDVLFYIDGQVVGRGTANNNRPDLAILGSTNHGFQISFNSLPSGPHTFEIFAIDPTGLTISLGQRQVTV